ncbi:hypothetical protein [Kistimonas asteriae]|nr:hypothetical protein [Kistimonas asteriae]
MKQSPKHACSCHNCNRSVDVFMKRSGRKEYNAPRIAMDGVCDLH